MIKTVNTERIKICYNISSIHKHQLYRGVTTKNDRHTERRIIIKRNLIKKDYNYNIVGKRQPIMNTLYQKGW